jgi:RNA polymerase sigma-70 factor (ECF subfamily)
VKEFPVDSLDVTAVEDAYRKHGHSVLRRARVLLANEAEAMEALQEIFLDLLERRSLFESRSSLLTYLYSATTHHCLNRIRNRRSRDRLLEQNPESLRPGAAGMADAHVELRQFLERLDGDVSAVAVFHYLDGMTQDEIAEVMSCSRRHVGHLLQRLRDATSQGEESP